MFTKKKGGSKNRSNNSPYGDESTMDNDPVSSSSSRTSNKCSLCNPHDELRWYRWVNLFAFGINVAVTYGVGVAGLFGLQTNTDVSAKYPTLVTPDGYAFAIWGIIFLAQGIWTLQQFITPCCVRLSYTYDIAAVRSNYAFVVLAQVMWTISFGNEWILPSAIIMMVILWNLGVIVFRQLKPLPEKSWYSNALTKFPFHIHFGWILVASIVNVNVALTSDVVDSSNRIRLYGGAIGGLIVLIVASLLIIFGAGFYFIIPGVAVWGLVAIYMEDQSAIAADFSSDELALVKNGALGSAGLIALLAIIQGSRKAYMAWSSRSRGPTSSSSTRMDNGAGGNNDSSGTDYYRRVSDDGVARV